ncbi:MAG: hypothetical protein KIT07_06295 [Anaerolineales bacterium]|jgi:hypothetical protein|nr:hypothetical protein [Anaerolineales bacterium]
MKRVVFIFALLAVLLAACQPAAVATPAAVDQTSSDAAADAPVATDLSGIKEYLTAKVAELEAASAELVSASDAYYSLAEAAGFDYAALWATAPAEAAAAIMDARAAWLKVSPLYEQTEGIVAGVPTLADYDVILDAGASGAEDPEGAVPFDLQLPDGRVLPQPGNLFGVLESTLWGTYADYSSGVVADVNADGEGFADLLPDANVLKGAADLTHSYIVELKDATAAWTPTDSDAYTALVVMVPTMSEYFESWKNSRFVAGDASTQRDFVVISRLADIQDILTSLEVVYTEIKAQVASVDADQAEQIEQGLVDLKAFVAGVYAEEQAGKTFTAEEADVLGQEAQDRATAVAGQVAQVAAALNVEIAE